MSSTEIEMRLTELEGRYAFLADLVNQLDSVIGRQQSRIDEADSAYKGPFCQYRNRWSKRKPG